MGWTSEARQVVGSSGQITRRVYTRRRAGAQKGISDQVTVYVKLSVSEMHIWGRQEQGSRLTGKGAVKSDSQGLTYHVAEWILFQTESFSRKEKGFLPRFLR